MRLATYNVENLFTRARVLNMETWQEGRPLLEAYNEINRIFENETYSDADRRRIVELLGVLGLTKADENKNAILRKNRGELLKRSRLSGLSITASGRDDWIGWVELKAEVVDEHATRNTAQCVRDVGADVLAVCEAEGRNALLQFSGGLLRAVGGEPYEHVMLIDGNDDRGIDVGLLTKQEYPIVWMRSHVDDRTDEGSLVFSRDCAEYLVWTPSGQRLWMLVNHFKSKGYGRQEVSKARRQAQAHRVAEIYARLRAEGEKLIVVCGDLNDSPGSDPLLPLLAQTDLKDVSLSDAYQNDGHPGTFANGTAREKIDYLLCSPELFSQIRAAGVWRRGVWGGKNGDRWEIYPEIKRPEHAASDHAVLWCDVEV
jgi:endonuclease/exonuclease/phosphatase family metal-dependent hydrolase